MIVDFHMHSTYSDGVYTPKELVSFAEHGQLGMIALTDHDEIAGIKPMKAYATSIDIVIGAEFSADYKGKDIHVLGYGFNCDDRELREYISYYQQARRQRIKAMIDLCQKAGYCIDYDELVGLFPTTKALGRPHVAQLLMKKGYAESINFIFKHIVNPSGPCYVPKVKTSVEQVIEQIHHAGGLAVLAHPKLIHNDTYVEELLHFSFDGIEVYHSKHDDEDVKRYRIVAEQRGLLITGGSDFHGINHTWPTYIGEYTVQSRDVEKFIQVLRTI